MDAFDDRGFQTPIAETLQAEFTPYWLGAEFCSGADLYQISSGSGFAPMEDGGLQFSIMYFAARHRAGGGVDVLTLAKDARLLSFQHETARTQRGSRSEMVKVGPWDAELFYLTSGTRPVNLLALYVDLHEVTVIAFAHSGTTGVPGTDWNPLLESQALISVMSQLQPYPQQ